MDKKESPVAHAEGLLCGLSREDAVHFTVRNVRRREAKLLLADGFLNFKPEMPSTFFGIS